MIVLQAPTSSKLKYEFMAISHSRVNGDIVWVLFQLMS